MPGAAGYMLASSPTEAAIIAQTAPPRSTPTTTHPPTASSKSPDSMVNDAVARAMPAPTEM